MVLLTILYMKLLLKFKTFTLLFLLSIGSSTAKAQSMGEADSLQDFIKNLALINPQQAHRQALQMQQQARRHSDSLQLAYAFLAEGAVHMSLYRYRAAERAFHQALTTFQSKNYLPGTVSAFQQSGKVAYLKGNTYRALGFFERALQLSPDSISEAVVLSHYYLAAVELELERPDAALKHARKALQHSKTTNLKQLEGMSYNLLAEIYLFKNDNRRSQDLLTNALLTNHAHGNTHEETRTYLLQGRLDQQNQRWQDALRALNKGIQIESQDTVSPLLIELFLEKSKVWLQLNQPYRSRSLAMEAERLYLRHYRLEVLKVKIYQQLAQVNLALGDSNAALRSLLIYRSLADSIRSFDLEKMLLQRELNQQASQNERLAEQNEDQVLRLNRSRLLLLLAAVLIIMAVLAIMALSRSIKRRKKYNELLKQRNEEQLSRHQEIDRLHEELKLKNEELEKLDKAKTKVFSVLTHDLRQPINQIRSVLELLEADQLQDQDRKMMVKQLKQSVDNSSGALENLLLWSKRQLRGIETRIVDVHLLPQVWQVESHVAPSLKEKNLKLRIQVPDFMKIQADISQLDICLKNLLSNAIKFSNPGDTISIIARDSEEYSIIMVKDQGVGMKPEQVEKMNTSDTGFSTMGTLNEKGTGLGMLITKDFMKGHGGRLVVESVEREGSSFKLLFPKNNPRAYRNGNHAKKSVSPN